MCAWLWPSMAKDIPEQGPPPASFRHLRYLTLKNLKIPRSNLRYLNSLRCLCGGAFQNCAEPWMAEPKRHMDVPKERVLGSPSAQTRSHPTSRLHREASTRISYCAASPEESGIPEPGASRPCLCGTVEAGTHTPEPGQWPYTGHPEFHHRPRCCGRPPGSAAAPA